MIPRSKLFIVALLGAALPWSACSDPIPVPTPRELEAKQIEVDGTPMVELSWRVVVRVDEYRLLYHDTADRSGPPYDGTGLSLVDWPDGCVAPDADAGGRLFAADGAVGDTIPADGEADGPADAGAADVADSTVDVAIADAVVPADSATGAADTGARDLASGGDGSTEELAPGNDADSPVRVPAVGCLETNETDAGPEPTHSPGRRPRIRLQRLKPGTTYHFAVRAGRRGSLSAISDDVSLTVAPGR